MKEISYKMVGDYQIPDLVPPQEQQVNGKYALMRLSHFKKNDKALYTSLLMQGKLPDHLMEIQATAEMRVEQMVEEMAKKENITEEMKAKNPMNWIGLMNNLKMSAEEIVAKELIYS